MALLSADLQSCMPTTNTDLPVPDGPRSTLT
jgi:hypothetical protein